ncbi:MAG: glycosyltransferase family 4 protein, partial [Chloroflexi bacterium]|nr:glycosyltransferase family 4 protein [Chloroflexota bacterium]
MAVLNIVLCTHRFLPRFKGGVEVYTLHLARALQGFGHQVSILTGEPIPKTDDTLEVVEDEYEGISLIRLKYDYLRQPVTFRAGYSAPNITTHIKAILQKLVPDIVHATSLSLLMGGTIGAASSLGIPTIYTATDFVLTCRRGTYLKWDNTICNEKEEIDLCTVCMEPHAQLEIWLDRVWRMAPKRLAQTMLASVENLVDKRADFVYAAA